jgi:mono/diheme cytochrome c family protein
MKREIVVLAAFALLAGCAKNAHGSAAATSAPPASAAILRDGAESSDGAKVYATNCSTCHQANGQGLEGEFPPLAGNPVVIGDPAKVIHVVKYGLSGKIHMKGQEYNGMMPAWGQQLSDADIASAITYIRSSWRNNANAVEPADVAAVKQ